MKRQQYKLLQEKYNVINEEEDSDLIAGINALSAKVYVLISTGVDYTEVNSGSISDMWVYVKDYITDYDRGDEPDDTDEEEFYGNLMSGHTWTRDEEIAGENIEVYASTDKNALISVLRNRVLDLNKNIAILNAS